MAIRSEIYIDLKKFGGEGQVIMAFPSARALNNMNNALGRTIITKMVDGKPEVVGALVGDKQLIEVLAYVWKAPFKQNIDSFLAYCDTLDEKMHGASVDLLEEMTKAKESIEKGDESPFVGSQAAEITKSE